MAAMLSTAPSTVLSMSRSLPSRKTRFPERTSSLGEVEPAGEDELQPDLVEADAVAEHGDHRLRLGDGRHVEGDDQAVARGDRKHGRSCFAKRREGQRPIDRSGRERRRERRARRPGRPERVKAPPRRSGCAASLGRKRQLSAQSANRAATRPGSAPAPSESSTALPLMNSPASSKASCARHTSTFSGTRIPPQPASDQCRGRSAPARRRTIRPSAADAVDAVAVFDAGASRMRLTQAIALTRSGGGELLYSGVAMKTPCCAAMRRANLSAFSGMPFSSSRSPL